MFMDVDLQINLGFRLENSVFTDVEFHLKSGFKKILCLQMLVFTVVRDSQKYCVHHFFSLLTFSTPLSRFPLENVCLLVFHINILVRSVKKICGKAFEVSW